MEAMTIDSVHPRHILLVDDMSAAQIKDIFVRAAQFKEKGFTSSRILDSEPGNAPLVALAFFEPSTRTRLSFDAAAQRIGCNTIGFDNPELTSSAKGEQLQDTLRVIEQYADAIVVRRKEHQTIDIIRNHVSVPVISAGVGAQEHPTQALLDVFTIQEHRALGSVNHVASYGDLVNSRTMISQVRLLAREGITLSFIAPEGMQITGTFRSELEARGANVITTDNLDEVTADVDVLHVIRPQRERWEGQDYNAYAPVDASVMSRMKSDALVLHALPRTGELDPEIDSDPRNVIFEQVRNGMYIRAALLEWLLS